MLYLAKQTTHKGGFLMKSITQDIKYYQAILSYADQHGVTKAAIKYRTYRQFISRLRNRYDGTPESLAPKSRRPHHHPNEHSDREIALIRRMRKRRPNTGLVCFWVHLRKKGYTRSITGLDRCMKCLGRKAEKAKKPAYKPKPYEQATFPGQKVQIYVKVVPSVCIVGQTKEQGEKMYQYTAIDECTRFRFIAAFKEQSTYSSMIFLQQLIRRFPFKIHKVQTDNGTEFTKRFQAADEENLTLFEKELKRLGIAHQKIRPYTPRHNGKVERSHRKDNEEFYVTHTFYSFVDFKVQLARRNREYNNFPMRPLGWKSPRETLSLLLSCVTYD